MIALRLYRLLGVLFTVGSLGLTRLLEWPTRPGRALADAVGLDRLAARFPAPTLLAANALVLLPASSLASRWASALPSGDLARAAAFVVALGVFTRVATVALALPGTVAALQQRVAAGVGQRWLSRRLANPLDAVLARLALDIGLVALPGFAAFVWPGPFSWLQAWLLVCTRSVIGDPHETLDHIHIHNDVFRATSRRTVLERLVLWTLRVYVDWVLATAAGRIPHWYQAQHIAVHHAENNSLDDTQTTQRYDRLSFFAFCQAGLDFGLSLTFAHDVLAYLRRKGRSKPARRLWLGLTAFHLGLCALAFVNWTAALVVLGLRLVQGPWGALTFFLWHGLYDAEAPADVYRNSVTLTKGPSQPGSHAGMGQLVHLEHHLHQGRHWSQASDAADNEQQRYEAARSVLIFGTYTQYFSALWTRRPELLRECLRFVGLESPDEATFVALAQSRLRAPDAPARWPWLQRLDVQLGGWAAKYLV